jgi:hypothetical protein
MEKGGGFSGFLGIDGDWFGQDRCLIIYKDSKEGIVFFRFSDGEIKEEVEQDIKTLIRGGYPLKGLVCDGKPAIFNACISFNLPVQRCLVHLQMGIQTLVTRRPGSKPARDLLIWSHCLNDVTCKYESKIMVLWFLRLLKRHRYYLTQKPDNKRTAKIQQAYSSIINARGHIFSYLRHKGLPKDTNGLEGFFSQLDTKVSRHRGLSQPQKENLISWLLFFRQTV